MRRSMNALKQLQQHVEKMITWNFPDFTYPVVRRELRRFVLEELLKSADEDVSDEFLDALDRFWEDLSGLEARERLMGIVPRGDRDPLDAHRIHRRMASYFAAGVASFWLKRRLRDAEGAWRHLPTWFERLIPPRDGAPRTFERGWPTEPGRLLDALLLANPHAAEPIELVRHILLPHIAKLDGRKFDRRPSGPSVELTLVSRLDPSLVGRTFRATLELVDGHGHLIEHPRMWDRKVAIRFARTIRHAWLRTWPESARRPSALWHVEPKDIPDGSSESDEPAKLLGISHGLAFRIGFRALKEGKRLDPAIVFSAGVKKDKVTRVVGLRAKADRLLAEGKFDRFVVCEDNVGDGQELSDEQVKTFGRKGLAIVPVDTVDAAWSEAIATRDPILDPYLGWVQARHERIQVSGAGRAGSPVEIEVDLDDVYIALRGIDVNSSEMKAAVDVALREPDRPLVRDTSWNEPVLRRAYGRLMEIAPLSHVFEEDDRRAAGPGPARPGVTDLARAIQENPLLVILGGPGTGKTTLLRWLARHSAEAVYSGRFPIPTGATDPGHPDVPPTRDLGPGWIPILIRASQIVESLKGVRKDQAARVVWDAIQHPRWDDDVPRDLTVPRNLAPRQHPAIPADELAKSLDKAIRDGRALILIDGLDEVASLKEWKALGHAIAEFLGDPIMKAPGPTPGRGNRVVITTREVGYQFVPVPAELAPRVFRVQPMERADVERFCRNWYLAIAKKRGPLDPEAEARALKQAQALIDEVYAAEAPTRAELARGPLDLTLMANIHSRPGGELPRRRPALYRLTIDFLIDHWSQKAGATAATPDAPRIWNMLGVVATEIHHKYPTNMIDEAEAEKILLRAVGLRNQQGEAKVLVDRFFENSRETGGLFVEVAHHRWRFLHMRHQEYLSARYLLRDQEHAPARLLERIKSPRWKEPLLLALGIASDDFSEEGFEALLKVILDSDDPDPGDPLKRLLPRATLLMVDAVKDMNNVPGWLWRRLAERLMATYVDREKIGRFGPLRTRIEASFATLDRHWRIPADHGPDRNGLEDYLVEQLEAPDRAPSVARLIRVNQWHRHDLVEGLFEARRHDSAREGWVIDRVLREMAVRTAPAEPAGAPGPGAFRVDPAGVAERPGARPPSLRESDLPSKLHFRRWFWGATRDRKLDVVGFLYARPEWLRLVSAYFGGLGDFETPRRLREYYGLVRVLQFGGLLIAPEEAREAFPEDEADPIHQVARYLDAYGKDWLRSWDVPPRFRGEYLYRDTESTHLSFEIQKALDEAIRGPGLGAERDPLARVVALLRKTWDDPKAGRRERSEALAGLVALGPDAVDGWDRLLSNAADRPPQPAGSRWRRGLARVARGVGLAGEGPARRDASAPTPLGRGPVGAARGDDDPLLDEVRRVRASLSDPIVRAAKRVIRAFEPAVSDLAREEETVIHVVGGVMDLAIRHGSVPLLGPNSDEYRCGPKARGFFLAEAWAFWLSGATDDIQYNAAVVLDTLGKRFQADPMGLILATVALPGSRNLRWADHLGWPIEMVPPSVPMVVDPAAIVDQATIALDAVAAMPNELEFVRHWALGDDVLLRFLRQKAPGLVHECRAILLSYPFNNNLDVLDKHWDENRPAEADFPAWLSAQALKINDPYLRARYLARKMSILPSSRADVLAAFDVARKVRQGTLHRALILERLIPLAGEDRPRILKEAIRAVGGLDVDNQARAATRLARYASGRRRRELLARAASRTRRIKDEGRRAEAISLQRRDWALYPEAAGEADRAADGIRDPFYRAVSAGLLSPIFRRFHDKTIPAARALVKSPGWKPQVRDSGLERLAVLDDPADWAVLDFGALLDDAGRDLDPRAAASCCWMALARGGDSAVAPMPEERAFEAIRAASAEKELPLDRAAALAIDALIDGGRLGQFPGLLSRVGMPDPSVVPIVDRWSGHADPTVRRHAALLLAEAGVIRTETVPDLVECLLDEEDRVRYRAARVCYYPRNGRHTRGLTAEVMDAIAFQLDEHRHASPRVSLALSWLWQNTHHNDAGAVANWVARAGLGEVEGKLAAAILRSIKSASAEVWAVLIASIEAPGPAASAVLHSIAGMLERSALSAERQREVEPILKRIAVDGPMASRVLAVHALGHFAHDPTIVSWLAYIAAGPEAPPELRPRIDLALGRLAMNRIDKALKGSPGPDELIDLARQVEDLANRLKVGGRESAEFLASVHLAWRSCPALAGVEDPLPRTAEALGRRVGDPYEAFRALLDSERYNHTWGFHSKRMVEVAAEFVVRHDEALIGRLVADLAAKLEGEVSRRPDYILMNLLAVTARVAPRRPDQFASSAQEHPRLADRLADAAVRCDAFPGRAGAVFLLGMLRRPLDRHQAGAIVSALHDVWGVQTHALEAADRLRETSDKTRNDLYDLLTGRSAIAAYAASRMLVQIGTDPRTPDSVSQEIVAKLAEAADHREADRYATRLDENMDNARWCLHHLGRLQDIFYEAMMTLSGLGRL